MKKTLGEVDKQQLSDLVARLDEIERWRERIDPSPKIEALEPYPLGGQVFSVVDLEARYPLIVRGYPRPGHILVTVLPGEPERSLPIASVVPLEKCKNAQPSPTQIYERMDPKAREYFTGRREAEIAAKVSPPPPAPPKQRRWFGSQGQIPTYGGASVGTGNEQ